MKHNKTIFLAVLALISLAGCSSDDEETTDSGKTGVNINVEQLMLEEAEGSTTRSMYNPDGNSLYWQDGDIIRVYDSDMMLYDTYVFDPTQSLFVCKKAVSAIGGAVAYALSPETLTEFGSWDDDICKAVMNIPPTYVYSAASESEMEGKRLFAANLPMWGKASGTFGNVQISLKYLTAVLKLKLVGAKGKATFLKLSSSKPLSGAFEAIIAQQQVANEDAILKKGSSSLKTQNYLIVDLRQMPQSDGVLYLPIIPNTYSDLTLSYTTKAVAADATLDESSIKGNDGTEWTLLKAFDDGKQMKRNIAYVLTRSF